MVEASEHGDVNKLSKSKVIEEYKIKLETVVGDESHCPYCFYDRKVSGKDYCSGCPGVLPNGEGFPNVDHRTPCYATDSPYKDFEFAFGDERKAAIREMYELTKRVAKYYNVEV